jgi:hypothetical protein
MGLVKIKNVGANLSEMIPEIGNPTNCPTLLIVPIRANFHTLSSQNRLNWKERKLRNSEMCKDF